MTLWQGKHKEGAGKRTQLIVNCESFMTHGWPSRIKQLLRKWRDWKKGCKHIFVLSPLTCTGLCVAVCDGRRPWSRFLIGALYAPFMPRARRGHWSAWLGSQRRFLPKLSRVRWLSSTTIRIRNAWFLSWMSRLIAAWGMGSSQSAVMPTGLWPGVRESQV